MPYYRHLSTVSDPTIEPLGTYTTAQAAHADKGPGDVVTFVESRDEQIAWQAREQGRLDRGEYVPVPFHFVWQTREHFVHLSKRQPGQIAFTKCAEHGVNDRQTTMRPGRYLEEFYKDSDGTALYRELWPAWIAACSASAVSFQIATSADDIEEIYRNGPRSCMSDEGACASATGNPARPFGNQPHPTRVYGDSDLQLAYMGEKSHATARALIWPEKKYYGRLYGNTDVLRVLLEEAGYQDAYDRTYDSETGSRRSIAGARIRKITFGSRGRIVCPYVDGIEKMTDDGDGWYSLDPYGDIDCQVTGGYTIDEQNECSHCGTRHSEDGAYCDSCEDDRRICERCEESHWDGGSYCDSCQSRMTSCSHCGDCVDDDDVRTVEEPELSLCNHCFETHASNCAACENVTIAHSLMSRTVRRQRDANGTADLCESCISDGMRHCDDCDSYTEHRDDGAGTCIDCTPDETPEPDPAPVETGDETDAETCDGPTPDGLLFDLTPISHAQTERLF